LLVDRQEISGAGGGSVEVTDHRARITERLNSIAKRQAPDDDGASDPGDGASDYLLHVPVCVSHEFPAWQ
jgi:hypothetical protein